MSASATLGLDASRSADPAQYVVSGATPAHAVRPTSADEVSEALRAATADDLKVLIWGAGSSLHMMSAPAAYDVALDVTALKRVIEYDPDDLTIAAECGATIDALRAAVGPKNQELPLEGSRSDVATLGGVLSSNSSGPRRYRFGAPVDRILGARFALGDGTLSRTGGKVVKNVAGYANHRLMCGAYGGLGVLLEASIKLMPAPDARRVLIYPCDARDVADPAKWQIFQRLDVAALSIVGRELARTLHIATPTPSDFVVIIGLEDAVPWIEEQTSRTTSALGEPVAQIDGEDVHEMWQALADLEEQPAPRMSFTTATRSPEALGSFIEKELAHAAVFHATAGRLHVHLDPRASTFAEEAARAGGFECIDHRGVDFTLAPATPSLSALRGALQRQLDPAQRFTGLGPWAPSRVAGTSPVAGG